MAAAGNEGFSPTFGGESKLERGIQAEEEWRDDRRVRSGTPKEQRLKQPNGEDRRLSSRLASQRPPAGGLYFFARSFPLTDAAAAGGKGGDPVFGRAHPSDHQIQRHPTAGVERAILATSGIYPAFTADTTAGTLVDSGG
jgi:hypothetical protein